MRDRVLGLSLLLFAACGGGHKLTFRSACEDVGNAVCTRVAQCSPPGVTNCAQTFVQTCCAATANCDAEITEQGAQAAINQCVADEKQLDCASVENGDLPPSCQD